MERLRGQVSQRDTQLRTTTVSQQAWQVAPQMGVNAQALLGSTAWQQAAAQLDPAAPDYTQRLAWTIQGIAAQNPWMAQPATPPTPPQPPTPPPTSGGEFPGGQPGNTPITEAQLAQMTPEQIAQAMSEGKLKHLL
ncbi:hypothetical protein A6A27_10285 [Micromonospora sp. CB01531]|nr:hypothetical protein A6A27_10285 [Micromonospora sp. CB01531]